MNVTATTEQLNTRPDPMDRQALMQFLLAEKAAHQIDSADSERLTALLKHQNSPDAVAIRIAELHALQFDRELTSIEARELRRLQLEPKRLKSRQIAQMRNLQQYQPNDPALTPEAIRNLEQVLSKI